MGTFSLWHWGIVLMMLGIYVAPVFWASRQKYLERRDYIWRTLAAIAGILALSIGSGFMQARALHGPGADIETAAQASVVVVGAWVVNLVLVLLITTWSVHRLQDLEWSRWIALLMIVPAVNLIFIVVLMCAARKKVIVAGN